MGKQAMIQWTLGVVLVKSLKSSIYFTMEHPTNQITPLQALYQVRVEVPSSFPTAVRESTATLTSSTLSTALRVGRTRSASMRRSTRAR